ncbi:hypothetical protein AIOL_000790 [Candidatus Rhodobacter oscarellae]|uniref:SCP domain-containing protein n=1 Tax=Candidatus Rhodobacter oscarellae TaxID=1675527 RepID=A0A0J9ED88_9RHOB|nr:CAP domain-containing protein [Candidatus Rhodobacter lobularis]KMW60626.1 hypothetical protein AIOL_000790 [Candidatus Rhodobacter lobularis]
MMWRICLAALVSAMLSAAPSMACTIPPGAKAKTQSVLADVNALRRKAGLRRLQESPQLEAAARIQACHMSTQGRLTHDGPGGQDIGQRILSTGYQWRAAAENIADGYPFADGVVAAWARSPSHRKNMMHRDMRHAGVALAYRGAKPYWVLVVAAKR